MWQGLVFVVMGVQRGHSRQTGGRGIWQILVAFQPNCHANLGFRTNRHVARDGSRPHHSQDASTAAYRHALSQGDLRGHSQSEFDFVAFGQSGVRKEKDSTGTQVLGESDALH